MNDPKTRLYGMADPSNKQSAAQNGMRGEGASEAAVPAFRHTVKPDGQPPIEVEEASGDALSEDAVRERSGTRAPE